jgi:hypothetical protein
MMENWLFCCSGYVIRTAAVDWCAVRYDWWIMLDVDGSRHGLFEGPGLSKRVPSWAVAEITKTSARVTSQLAPCRHRTDKLLTANQKILLCQFSCSCLFIYLAISFIGVVCYIAPNYRIVNDEFECMCRKSWSILINYLDASWEGRGKPQNTISYSNFCARFESKISCS